MSKSVRHAIHSIRASKESSTRPVASTSSVGAIVADPVCREDLDTPDSLKRERENPGYPGFFIVRPAWAHTCGCKSRCELVTVSKAKRNCVRATERGKEAWSLNRELMNKNRIEGAAKQGEWAMDHEARDQGEVV